MFIYEHFYHILVSLKTVLIEGKLMDIHYYDDHSEEFEKVTQALKTEMETIWGSQLKDNGETIDNEKVYAELFEELQFNFSREFFSSLDPAQSLSDEQIAAFVAKSRRYKTGITTKCIPAKTQKWIKSRVEPLGNAKGTNLIWIDTAAIEHIGAGRQFNDQYYLTVTTRSGKTYRVNDFLLPGHLLNYSQEALLKALASVTGGEF